MPDERQIDCPLYNAGGGNRAGWCRRLAAAQLTHFYTLKIQFRPLEGDANGLGTYVAAG